MSRQLAFDLPPRTSFDRADLIVTPANRLALAALDGWRDWPGGKMLLAGPSGAGKTHLARIWATDAGAATVEAGDLAAARPDLVASAGAVLVEDGDRIAGDKAAETALFHLHNLVLAQGGRLLVTAAAPPRDWGLVLPDLLSRMQAAPLTRLDGPDDTLLHGVLTKLFADRQITPPPGLVAYVVARMPRSIGAARAIVAEMDARALSGGRPVGLRLAAEVLAEEPPE